MRNWQMMPGDPFDETYVSSFMLAAQKSDPVLQRTLAGVKASYDVHADPETPRREPGHPPLQAAMSRYPRCHAPDPSSTTMFHLPLPILEKLLRPVIVYLVLVVLLRIFGKRELAQLNPFDLVVLLSLSNTVQNAIIGDDNSVTGGVIGAFGLLAINWLVVRALFRSPRLTRMLEGRSAVLVLDGQIDRKAIKHESLTREELLEAIHRQGFEHVDQVAPLRARTQRQLLHGIFEPSKAERNHDALMARIDALAQEIAGLRSHMTRNS